MQQILDFLKLVRENNNREWFNAHKDLYLNAKKEFDSISLALIDGVKKWDKSCALLSLNDCTYRFYRDIRFSKDKRPYKNHFGVYICPKGKKSSWAGYYFHIEPELSKHEKLLGETEFLGHSMITGGDYMLDKYLLQSIREDIYNNGDSYIKAIKKANKFYLCDGNKVKTMPKGFPKGKYDDLIRMRFHLLEYDIDEKFLLDKNLIKNVNELWHSCYDFVKLCNEAFSYSGNY